MQHFLQTSSFRWLIAWSASCLMVFSFGMPLGAAEVTPSPICRSSLAAGGGAGGPGPVDKVKDVVESRRGPRTTTPG